MDDSSVESLDGSTEGEIRMTPPNVSSIPILYWYNVENFHASSTIQKFKGSLLTWLVFTLKHLFLNLIRIRFRHLTLLNVELRHSIQLSVDSLPTNIGKRLSGETPIPVGLELFIFLAAMVSEMRHLERCT